MSSQVIAKRDPLEQVGNVVAVDGRLVVIEYSDLPGDVAQRRNADGCAGHLGRQHCGPRLRAVVSGADGGRRPRACLSTSPARRWPTWTAPAGGSSRAAQRPEIRALHFRPHALGRRRGGDRGRSGPGLRPAEERLRRAHEHAGDGAGPDDGLASRLAAARGVEVADDVAVEINPLFALDAEELAGKVPAGTKIAAPTYLRRGRNKFAPHARLLLPRAGATISG